MRAVVLSAFGPADLLVAADMPDPVAGPGQVLVEVELASITFVETQIRAGRPPHPSMAPALPVVPGNGVGGTVTAVGDGVDAALIGRRVVTTTGGTGGYAEHVAVAAAGVIELPDRLSIQDAVALLADGRTALSLFDAAQVQAGETVLVEAAGGGVGSLLVQLASNAGAIVVAAAAGARKLELARELGAARAVDYSLAGWTGLAGCVDVVFDGVGGAIGRMAFDLVRPGGRFCGYGMASGSFSGIDDEIAADYGVSIIRGGRLSPERMRALSSRALREAAAGRLRPVVGQTFPLERASDAHAAIEARETVGKTLLVV